MPCVRIIWVAGAKRRTKLLVVTIGGEEGLGINYQMVEDLKLSDPSEGLQATLSPVSGGPPAGINRLPNEGKYNKYEKKKEKKRDAFRDCASL